MPGSLIQFLKSQCYPFPDGHPATEVSAAAHASSPMVFAGRLDQAASANRPADGGLPLPSCRARPPSDRRRPARGRGRRREALGSGSAAAAVAAADRHAHARWGLRWRASCRSGK
jgi:hypothetical protein